MTDTTHCLPPTLRPELFHCENCTCCVLFNSFQRRLSHYWRYLHPSLQGLPVGKPLPDVAGGLGQITGLPVLFAIPTRRWAVLGSVQGAAVSSCASTERWALGPEKGALCLVVGRGQPPACPITDRDQVPGWSGVGCWLPRLARI